MVKRLFFLVSACLLSVAVNAQTWVSFSKSDPAAPEFSVISSSDHTVVFSMELPGMFVETKTEGSQTYQRLFLPECNSIGEVGSPEIPVVLSQLIAVPECDNIVCTVQITGSQTFTDYMVYPVPDRNANGEEVFTLDAGAYAQNAMTPVSDYQVSDNGYLRSQAYTRLTLNPLRYNPAAQTLTVATAMTVTLTFVNATTPVNANIGIFANVAANSFLNFEPTGITAAINDMAFAIDSASWEDETQFGTVYEFDSRSYDIPTVPTDYLIIYADAFSVNGSAHPEILRLAQHRALYNALNVLIVPAEVLISDAFGLPYEGNNGVGGYDLYKKEQRIRSFIRMMYEQRNAPNTYDGYLGYVLLIGDIDNGNNGMPGSYDHAENNPNQQGNEEYWFPSDYYYSCVTHTGSVYDDVGDLFIGRLCLPNTSYGASQLEGQVDKIMAYEKEYILSPNSTWQNNVVLATGVSRTNGAVTNDWVNYNHDLASYYNGIAQNQSITHVNAYNNLGQYTQNIVNAINNGVGLVTLFNRGEQYSVDDINPLLMESLWTEDRKTPFGVFVAGSSGAIDGSYNNSLAKYLTNLNGQKGLVAALAPARSANMSTSSLAAMPKGYQCYIPKAIYTNLSTITGECVLEAKLNVNSEKYRYNLFGDPALNIVARGFEVTRDVVLEPETEISSWIKVYANVTVPNSATVLIKYNAQLAFYSGSLTIGNNATITGPPPMSTSRLVIRNQAALNGTSTASYIKNIPVRILGGTVNSVTFDKASVENYPWTAPSTSISSCIFMNTYVNVLSSHPLPPSSRECYYSNCTFYQGQIDAFSFSADPPFKSNFSNCYFSKNPLWAEYQEITLDSCTFTNRSDISMLNTIIADIKDCNFKKSGIYTTSISKCWGSGNIPLVMGYSSMLQSFVKVTGCTFYNTGTFVGEYIDNMGIPVPVYSTATITLKKVKDFNIAGNAINVPSRLPEYPDEPELSQFGEGIYLTDAGNGSAGNQKIQDNEIRKCITGVYVYGSKAQVLGNEIYGNQYGARLFNNSQTTFMGYDGVIGFCGYQIIRDNDSYEVYASNKSFPTQFNYNQIIDEDNKGNSQDDPLIYYDEPSSIGTLKPINISCNYWGVNFDQNEDLYPPNRFITSPIWDPQTGECSSGGIGLYDAGIDYFIAEDYPAAHAAFTELIETYPDDPFAIAALHELFALEQFLDNDYAALHDYYATFTPADSSLFDVADFLATRCNVVIENWQPAVDWYEDRIENPPSYQDSVFAVIDLGDIHLMMEEDTSFLKSGRTFLTRFPNIKPKSKQEYEENKSELLATLPKIDKPQQDPLAESGKKGVLSQNIPNPATGSTTIVYDVIEEGSVELRVYNQLGQLLQALPQGTRKQGSYRVEISLVGLPAGMYHYVLFVEGEKADAKKLIVN